MWFPRNFPCIPAKRGSIDPVADQIFDNRGIGQGGNITERLKFLFGNLAQDAAHDFAGTGFWQSGCELNDVRAGDRPDILATPGDEIRAAPRSAQGGSSSDVGIDALALDVVRIADHGGFGDLRMGDERAFTSAVPRRWPETLMTSSTRPVIQ